MDVNVVRSAMLRQTPQMHVFGVPEDMEGISTLKYLEKLIKTNFSDM